MTPHRYPDRQSAACVIFASYHWTHLRCEGSEGSKGSKGSKGGGIALRAMSIIMPPSAVTSTSSIIIILTLVHPFATSWPSSPKGDARTLRDWLSVSYVTQYPVPPIFSFPLEGKSREAGKGVRGRAPVGCSIAILTANRRPVSFLLLTLGPALQPPILKNGALSKAPFCCRYLAISAGITFVSSLPEDFFTIL